MSDITTTSLERENLEAHVDLCAERYKHLDLRLTSLEIKMDAVGKAITDSSQSMRTVIITSAATIVTAVLGLITTILMKF
jgi:ActR/RegA family two-component response regulator